MAQLVLGSSWGTLLIEARGGYIISCRIPQLLAVPRRPLQWRKSAISGSHENRVVLREAERFIKGIFQGRVDEPPPWSVPRSSEFCQKVWSGIQNISPGTTWSYGDLARYIGAPGSARAVGRACGANPLPLFIPCHRVIAQDGSPGGFSCGLPWKEHLLSVERKAAVDFCA